MKFFNTAGPVVEADHYIIDPLTRWDLEEIMLLIEQKKYFILHAPRQTGKTSCMIALRDKLNKEGKYFAVYTNVEVGQASLHKVKRALKAIAVSLLRDINLLLKDEFDFTKNLAFYETLDAESGLLDILIHVSQTIKKPIVLFIDEIDALIGDSLISVLRQLRSGYVKRPENFPSTIVLCGLRDIRDYRIRSSTQEIITGGSTFNVKAKSLKLGNFSKEEVIKLYKQHTEATGQIFTEDCYDLIMDYTNGQPWLVNALAYEVVHEIRENRPRSVVITPEKIEQAKENMVLERETHLDQLVDKLKEDRVKNVILPMIQGIDVRLNEDDLLYCLDLGLIKIDNKKPVISNSIYREIIPRVLTDTEQINFYHRFENDEWKEKDGRLSIQKLLNLFRIFWYENTSIVTENMVGYVEATPQLVMQAFLQRIVNGGGFINREYGLGRKRVDLMIKWKYPSGDKTIYQNIVLELKVIGKKDKYESVKQDGIEQTVQYTKFCGEKEAQLVIFDRDRSMNWAIDEPNELVEDEGVKVQIWKLGTGED